MRLLMYGAAGAGLAAAGFLRPSILGGDKIWTGLYKVAQVAERAVPPFQWMRTFRFPSIISPAAAPDVVKWEGNLFYETVREEGGRVRKKWYGKEGFGVEWLETVTGKTRGELTEVYDIFEHGLEYRQTGATTGDFWIGDKRVATDKTILRNAESMPDAYARAHMSVHNPELVARMEAKTELSAADILLETGQVRAKAAQGPRKTGPLPESAKIASQARGSIEGLFNTRPGSPHEWMPANVTRLPGEDLFPFLRKVRPLVEGARTLGAFASQRLTTVIQATAERAPFVGKYAHKFMPRKSSSLMMKGKFALGVGLAAAAGWKALEQMDWFRRKSTVGGASAYGGVAGAGALLAGATPQTALLAAAGTAALTATPIFEGGVIQGTAGLFMKVQQVRSFFSNLPLIRNMPFVGHKYREVLEETAPQITSPGVPLLAGLATTIGMAIRHNVKRSRALYGDVKPRHLLGQHWTEFAAGMEKQGFNWWHPFSSQVGSNTTLNVTLLGRAKAATWYDAAVQSSQAASARITREVTPEAKYQRGLDFDWTNKVYHAGENSGWVGAMYEQIKGAFAGADVHKMATEQGRPTFAAGGIKRLHIGRYGLIFASVATGLALVTGQFASPDTPRELKDKMEGKELVPVRKGRYWEGGGTPFEGKHIMYHRPHWYAMLASRARQKAIWGEEEDDISPISKYFRKTFTYELEKKHYYDRPYPITGSAFSEAPVISGLIAPIGQVIKPPKLMHLEDWAMIGSSGATSVMHELNDMESRPDDALGGFGPGMPVSPFSPKARVGEQVYQWTEEAGLLGYMATMGFGLNPFSLKNMTGMDSLYSQDNWLAEAGEMTSLRRWFWEQELGGMGFLSEPIRRFLPRRRSEIGRFNPIANTMPYWIPEDLRTGDPYAEVPHGEARMPGVGYAALHPELQGTDPSEYPIWHQYAILSDVAWWSREFRTVESRAKALIEAGALPEGGVEMIRRAEKRLDARKDRLQYDRYIDKYNERTADWSVLRRAAGRTWQLGTHGIHRIMDPIEYMATPVLFGFRPTSKLLPKVSPVEEYERDRVYGTRMAFWDKLGRDAIRPGVWSAMNSLGFDGIPPWLQEVRENEEYFDKLEYYKWKKLEDGASERGDKYLAKEYSRLARKTVHGRNPYERSMYVRASLPKKERDYFEAFIATTNPKERERILELVPPAMRNIYVAQWQRADYERTGDPELKAIIDSGKRTGGVPASENLYSLFQSEAPPGMSYGDWYKIKQMEGMPVPRPNWVGFNPAVDLEDVKLQMVMDQGANIQDYGLWDSQARLLARKPYINPGTIEPVVGGMEAFRRSTRRFASDSGLPPPQISSYEYYSPFPRNEVEVDMYDNRAGAIEGQRRLLGY